MTCLAPVRPSCSAAQAKRARGKVGGHARCDSCKCSVPALPCCLDCSARPCPAQDEADLDAAAAASLHSDEEDEQGEGQEEEQAEEGQGAEEQSIRAEALAGGVGLAGSEAPQGPGLPAGGQDEAAASGVSEEHRGGPLAFQRGNGDGYEPAMPTTSSSSRQWDGGGGGGSGSTRVHGSTAAAAEGSPAPPHATPTRIRPNASSLGATAPGGGAAAAPPTTPEAVRAQRQREAVRSQERQQRLRAYWGRPAYQWDGYERLLFAGGWRGPRDCEPLEAQLFEAFAAGREFFGVMLVRAAGPCAQAMVRWVDTGYQTATSSCDRCRRGGGFGAARGCAEGARLHLLGGRGALQSASQAGIGCVSGWVGLWHTRGLDCL